MNSRWRRFFGGSGCFRLSQWLGFICFLFVVSCFCYFFYGFVFLWFSRLFYDYDGYAMFFLGFVSEFSMVLSRMNNPYLVLQSLFLLKTFLLQKVKVFLFPMNRRNLIFFW